MIELRPRDARYPARLRELRHPPKRLWVLGDVDALARVPAVAVVGTRRLTPYGERVARELAGAAAAAGVVIVSGLAQGIDSESHRAALDRGGRSVAVLGEGLASFGRSIGGSRRALAARLRASGALVSEYGPEEAARGWMFARRNLTIAALADMVVVVEAGDTSGALITARAAVRLGRPLYAVPGPLGSARSVGTNELIASGAARALTGPATLLRALALAPSAAASAPGPGAFDHLAGGPLSADALAEVLGLTAERAAAVVAEALLRGEIVLTGDGRIARA